MYNQVLKSTIFSPSHNTILNSNSVLFHWGTLLKCIISNTTENNAKLILQINVIIIISF